MAESISPFSFPSFFRQFAAAPLELRSYLSFAIVVTAFDYLILFAPESLKIIFIPHTGQFVTVGYPFTLFFTGYMIYYKEWNVRWGIVILLLLTSSFGVFNILGQSELSEAYLAAMPYKEASVIRPFWTVLIPLIWVFVLHSKQVKNYCGKNP